MLSIAMTAVVGGEVQVASRMAGHMWEEEAGNVSKLALVSKFHFHKKNSV